MRTSGRSLGLACFGLALGLVFNSFLGPLVLGVIEYRYTETFENQGIGLDAFVLVIAAPLLVAAGVLSLRRHLAAPFLALGPAAMSAYMMPQYVLGAHYTELPGNNEDFFLLHLGLFVLSMMVVVMAWVAVDVTALPRSTRRSLTFTGTLLLAIAAFLVIRYLPPLVEIWDGSPTDEYIADPIAFWLIAFMDLGLVVPAAVACGVSLLLGVEEARKPTYAVISWFALVGPAVAAMGFPMAINDDPNASLAGAAIFAVFGAAFAILAAYMFRPLFRQTPDLLHPEAENSPWKR